MTRAELDTWMLAYIKDHAVTSGWDWEADLAWARVTGAPDTTIELMVANLSSSAPIAFRLNAYRSPEWQRVKSSRLRTLRRLTEEGELEAGWAGMPAHLTGATRTRAWTIFREK